VAGMSDAVRASYDAVADEYEKRIAGELAGKPLDRALLAAFAELVPSELPIGDVGCGPGHVAGHLAELGCDTVGIDLSPAMVDIARRRYPALRFQAASMLELPVADGAWGGAVAMYSIIHLTAQERRAACRELGRVVRPGGTVMIAFHVSDAAHEPGDAIDEDEFLGQRIELTMHFLRPDDVAADLRASGFGEVARMLREPDPAVEYPSRRCYLIARRAGH
jgi:SAM-dependent methyltransferase